MLVLLGLRKRLPTSCIQGQDRPGSSLPCALCSLEGKWLLQPQLPSPAGHMIPHTSKLSGHLLPACPAAQALPPSRHPLALLARAFLPPSQLMGWKGNIPRRRRSAQPTVVLHQGLHLLLDALMPLGDVHMQRVVTAGLAVGPFPPLVKGGQQACPRLRNHMVN